MNDSDPKDFSESRIQDELEAEFFPPPLMQQIRERFYFVESDPVTGDRTWLESASGSLRLKAAAEALFDQTRFPDQLGRTSDSSRRAGELVAQGIEDVRVFLNAKKGTIAPAMSSTHAVFRAVNAILSTFKGGNVVTTNLEHPCVYDSMRYFSRIYGQDCRIVSVDPDTGFVSAEAILEKVDQETRLIAMIHGSNMTGAILDVKHVVQEARKVNPDVLVLADGVQYAPHAPVDVEELGVDVYVFGPYKAFCVKGIGFAYLGERVASLQHWKLEGTAADAWSLGSPEDPTYAAWSAVVDYLDWLGTHFTNSTDRRRRLQAAMKKSDAHVRALLARLLHGTASQAGLLAMPHVTLHGVASETSHRVCLVLLSLDGMNSYEAVNYYNHHRIRVHNRVRDAYSTHTLEALGIEEGIRPSACHYNSPEEIDRFLAVTEAAQSPAEHKLSPASYTRDRRGPGEG